MNTSHAPQTATCPACHCTNVFVTNGRFARHTTPGAQDNATWCNGEVKATLKARVKRSPASLAGFHYFLEPGTVVYIADTTNVSASVSCAENPATRISEDYFTVPIALLLI